MEQYALETKDELSMDMKQDQQHATAEDWKKVLQKVIPAVVVLRTTACRAFDTHSAGSSRATGFVVDKRRGIILTNSHVVKPGPVRAEAMLDNLEEIPVYPIYRDPVHDFGFFRYDPAAVKFLSYEEIPLAPEAASVGLEIRVVGNDKGEKNSIFTGTLARLDRDAPRYGEDGYNDFNTFYIQVASGTKSGSSGSPVIDLQGRAVALNAGSKNFTSSAYLFPLERVVRALKILQNGRYFCHDKPEAVTIPRGTIQATFVHKGFIETRRLGLKSETEQLVRDASPPSETGMLVVDSVVPGGPACEHLEPGDVLVRMNGEVITRFLKMETLLDDSVGQNVELEFERGGTSLTVQLVVEDLHSITPNYFLEVSGGVIHPLSYQQARNFHFRCGLVYVAEPGYMLYKAGVPRHAIITRLDNKEVSNLDKFISVLSKLSPGTRVPLVYKTRHTRKSVLVTVDRHEWYASPQIYTRDDTSGIWIGKPALPSNSQLMSSGISSSGHVQEEPNSGTTKSGVGEKEASADGTVIAEVEDLTSPDSGNASVAEHVIKPTLVQWRIQELFSGGSFRRFSLIFTKFFNFFQTKRVPGRSATSLVRLTVYVPSSCMVDGVKQHCIGTGVIIFHSEEMGLVAVDKNTVAISASDIMLSFAAFPIEIPGEVVFLHPVHNYAIVAYDPSDIGPAGNSVVRAAQLLPEPALRRGDSVYLVGLSGSLQAKSRKSVVTNPRYRANNMEVIELDTDFGSNFRGVLTDEHGRVKALWGSFSTQNKYGVNSSKQRQFVRGIPIHSISQVVNEIISGAKGPSLLINGIKRPMPLVRVLEVEFSCTLLSEDKSFGLGSNWIQALLKKDPVRRQVLRVIGCLAGSKAENLLKQGDMILAINKKPVTCFGDVEDACHALDVYDDTDAKLELTIFRQGHEMEVQVGTDIRDGNGTTRIFNWCGCLVHDHHPSVRAKEVGHGVYVTRGSSGSPANRYGLYSKQWIVEVNGKPIPDLDAFVNVTKEIEDGEFVRVRTVDLNGKPQVMTLKQDLHYWPTWELKFDPETAMWRRKIIKSLETGDSL